MRSKLCGKDLDPICSSSHFQADYSPGLQFRTALNLDCTLTYNMYMLPQPKLLPHDTRLRFRLTLQFSDSARLVCRGLAHYTPGLSVWRFVPLIYFKKQTAKPRSVTVFLFLILDRDTLNQLTKSLIS